MDKDTGKSISNSLLNVEHKNHLRLSNSTNMLEEDLLSHVDELTNDDDKEDKRASQDMTDSTFVDMKSEDIDIIITKQPSPPIIMPPVPSILRSQHLNPKVPPPPPKNLIKPPPVPHHLRKLQFDIEYEILGNEQSAVTIYMNKPAIKCIVPSTSEMLSISPGLVCTNVEQQASPSASEDNNEVQLTYGSYSVRQFNNPKLTETSLEITLYRPMSGQIARLDLHNAAMFIRRGAVVCAVPQPSESVFENYISFLNVQTNVSSLFFEKVTGLGYIFVQCSGSLIQKTLGPNQELLVRSACVLGIDSTVSYSRNDEMHDEQDAMDIKLTGPGIIYLQTRP
ncbi:hypothetical protein AKO1_004082 [Acrasis kona]|uniref:Phospholipid scramblase n=1 Tax=Acrasis kona TaxID=1008807 RepID=A0AAW2YVN4_9EUKA